MFPVFGAANIADNRKMDYTGENGVRVEHRSNNERGGAMTLVLILAAVLAAIYAVTAAYLWYGFKKKFPL